MNKFLALLLLAFPRFALAMDGKDSQRILDFSKANIEIATEFCRNHPRKLIAIVDDTLMDRKVVSHFVLKNQYKEHVVILFNSGDIFLEALQDSEFLEVFRLNCRIVFLDNQMEPGLNGTEVISHLHDTKILDYKVNKRKVRIILNTNDDLEHPEILEVKKLFDSLLTTKSNSKEIQFLLNVTSPMGSSDSTANPSFENSPIDSPVPKKKNEKRGSDKCPPKKLGVDDKGRRSLSLSPTLRKRDNSLQIQNK